MIVKIYILTLLILIYGKGYGQLEGNSYNDKYFEIEVEIDDLGRDYVGCGAVKYTICVEGVVKSVSVFGKHVLLYITCPEILNGLPYGKCYQLKVEFYKNSAYDGIVHTCNNEEFEGGIKKTKLKVIDIKVLP